MSVPIFLTTDEFLEILIAELPLGVFADDLANDLDQSRRSVSSSELRAFATALAGLSTNLSSIYADKFLNTATGDGLSAYERDYFSSAQDGSLSIDARRTNIISKLRSTGGISMPAIQSVIAGILGPIPFDLLPYSGQGGVGAWILGRSKLGVDTWLTHLDPIIGARSEGGLIPLDCAFDYESQGLSDAELLSIQTTAYTFEVRIYGSASAETLSLLDARLTQLEPARSGHVIRNNQTSGPANIAAYEAATPEYERLRL
jgi:hypothetical protein